MLRSSLQGCIHGVSREASAAASRSRLPSLKQNRIQPLKSQRRRQPMALISLRQLLDHAAEHGYGVPAFNVNNLEQMRAIMEAADKTDSPVIVQASAGARKYAGAPDRKSTRL